MSEPLIEKHEISAELSDVAREKHRSKSHRVCRRDREPSRIPIRSLKRIRNKSRKVRKFVYARILSCIPMSSTLIRQRIRKVKCRASRCLTLFSCNKLMCSCKSEAHIANYCNSKLSRDVEKNPGPPIYFDPNKTIAVP
ncbi:hypothetical protein pdam_00019953 [Pocillopora damicornis]|uniref:Uncharacterized protein n=1 Tax=Pocillopora damicornis TaxID=46731 RepID=A0A3M6V3J8_POCDA|nr:hypothetical protein pdam_00019953 [Pocillopora damicornis]